MHVLSCPVSMGLSVLFQLPELSAETRLEPGSRIFPGLHPAKHCQYPNSGTDTEGEAFYGPHSFLQPIMYS